MGKKIGIITMHKVLNYGSALQAYALQNVLEDMGHDVEIIDYIYPNEYHKSFSKPLGLVGRCIRIISEALRGFPTYRRRKSFRRFYQSHLKLSRLYESKDDLMNNPPQYDLYMTGSDQVWNPDSIHLDTNFFLAFTDSKYKVAYSASFAKKSIPQEYKDIYASELNKYSFIFMREDNGCNIVKELINRKVDVVLDPTLLLNKNQWLEFAQKSKINIKVPYILIYVLGYSFDVYPYVIELINRVQSILKYHLVVLNIRSKYFYDLTNKSNYTSANIYDFIKLISEASLVITDSFHGTAFSINLDVPFYSIVDEDPTKDNRIYNLLSQLNLESRAIIKNTDLFEIDLNLSPYNVINTLDLIRQKSLDYLYTSVS